MILILDLDETLVYATQGIDCDGDFKIRDYCVKKRPHLDKFVDYLTDNPFYEVGVWSAGIGEYVRAMVDNIFPDPSILKFVVSREFCNEAYKKPLSKIRSLYNCTYSTDYGRDQFSIVDDRENITDYDELNHIKVKPFKGDSDDKELLDLIEFLDANKGTSSECLTVFWG